MDSRQPQHPFTRPPERLIHNPNHQSFPQRSPSHSYAHYSPSTSQPQPPLHAPFTADPYPSARRDPFFPPSSQHARPNNYAAHSVEGDRHGGWTGTARAHGFAHAHAHAHAHQHHHPASGPAPPTAMSSPHHHQPPYGYDARRRSFGGGASPPNPYRGPSHDPHPPPPPPPPPPPQRAHMPPPSSPQQQHQHQPHQQHASQTQRAPFSSSLFGGSRELPGLGNAHRPGSAISISSLIGGDTSTPNQPSQSHSSPPTNAPPSNNHTMQPPSPRRGLMSGPRSDFSPYRRQPSPDRHMYGGGAPRAPEGHGYPAASPTRSYSNQASPDLGRHPSQQSAQPYKPMVFQGQRSNAYSPNDAQARDSRQASSSVPPRPNSQPSGAPGHGDQEAGRTGYDNDGGRRSGHAPPEERRRTLGDSHHSRPNAAELLAGISQPNSERDRPVTVQPLSHSAFSPPRDQRNMNDTSQPPRDLWRHSAPREAPRQLTEGRRDEPSAFYRGYGYNTANQAPPSYGGHGAEEMVRGRSLDHLNHRVTEQYHAPPTSDPTSNEKHKAEQLSRSLSSGSTSYPRSYYDQPRKMGEEMQHSKSWLGLGPEANRRTGRASPLPQAVQGAQAQPLSGGKDPSIKSEFGRMFSGLGSGLGTSTPSRGSPMPQGNQESVPLSTDLNEHLRMQRVSSQNGKKPKRAKDEESTFDSESMDGRCTPSGVRDAKRSKQHHPSHHHHHHAHAHHHHHHHHRPDEDVQPLHASTPFNGRHSANPQNGVATSHHHHHHHHAGPHHHHHAPRANQNAPAPSHYVPPKVHNIQSVLDEAAKYPRKHLGSQLYEASPELPQPNSSLDDQFGYASKPKSLPRFDVNPINCLFTIRIPRFHLKPRQRQHVVLQRHLWGARVYRDDSDPIAAAIHSGWVRGEWDETVDVSMLDPRITAPNEASDAEDTLTKPPAAPVTPPAEMDLQIELLILPRILEYVSTVEYGISSRKSRWHEGLSFMIHKIRWVDDGIGSRGQDRTAAAMKKRLDASAALMSLKSSGADAFKAINGTTRLHA